MTEPTRESGDMRAAFEAWARKKEMNLTLLAGGKEPGEVYLYISTQSAFYGYQAAIATAQRDLDAARVENARLHAENGNLRRLLLPVWMAIAERDMMEEPLADTAVVFSFMGSGASDNVTVADIRSVYAALREPSA